ncbi:hypothetical protein C2I18_05350 [Paenibacillus sp. PK3_47]|uniref:MFS transporter n=1 Tax=Paenibacillus sp. PK3_47 TaxID=2072642 RepID=UPI00201E4244|nr:MFS transporter [Paenibacillus sp. PK3_47]UQZ33041.1 hypothetical protein C2I18_05350 [Paenibacillus sp. PK3_47]
MRFILGSAHHPVIPTAKLINKNNIAVLLTYIFSSLAVYIFDIGIIVELYKISGSSIAVGGFFILQFIPSLLLTPVAGALIDRWNQKYILFSVNLVRAAAVALLLFNLSIETIYAVAVILGVCDEISSSTLSSIIPQITDRNNISRLNSVFSAVDSVNMIFGPAVAGLFIALAGTTGSISAVLIAFIMSAILITIVKYVPGRKTAEASTKFTEEVKEGLKVVTTNPLVKGITLIWGLLLIAVGATGPLVIILLSEYLHLPSESYGWTMTFEGVGLVIGSFFIMRQKNTFSSYGLILFGMCALGLALTLAAFSNSLYIILLAYLIMGLGAASAPNGIRTTLQTKLPKEILGRVFASTRFVVNSLRTLSIALASILSNIISLRLIFVFAAILMLTGALLSQRLKVNEVGLKEQDL